MVRVDIQLLLCLIWKQPLEEMSGRLAPQFLALGWNGKESQKMLLHRKLLNFKSQSIEKYLRIVQNFWQEKSSTLRCSSSLPWWSGCQILCQKRNVLELARLEQCNLNIYTQKAIFGSTRKIWQRSAGALYHKKITNQDLSIYHSIADLKVKCCCFLSHMGVKHGNWQNLFPEIKRGSLAKYNIITTCLDA